MIRSAVVVITNRSVTRKLVTDTSVGRSVAHRIVAGTELSEAVDDARIAPAIGQWRREREPQGH